MKLLEKDGWKRHARVNHGVSFYKEFSTGKRITVIPDKRKPLPTGTLFAILGHKQTGMGRAGLQRLINKFGL